MIIFLSKIRDKSFKPYVRFDRAIPFFDNLKMRCFYASCCDCGLTHFSVYGKGIIPLRPRKYKYKFRLGAKAWHPPDKELGNSLVDYAVNYGLVRRDQLEIEEAK